jgi:hypothetical protein
MPDLQEISALRRIVYAFLQRTLQADRPWRMGFGKYVISTPIQNPQDSGEDDE